MQVLRRFVGVSAVIVSGYLTAQCHAHPSHKHSCVPDTDETTWKQFSFREVWENPRYFLYDGHVYDMTQLYCPYLEWKTRLSKAKRLDPFWSNGTWGKIHKHSEKANLWMKQAFVGVCDAKIEAPIDWVDIDESKYRLEIWVRGEPKARAIYSLKDIVEHPHQDFVETRLKCENMGIVRRDETYFTVPVEALAKGFPQATAEFDPVITFQGLDGFEWSTFRSELPKLHVAHAAEKKFSGGPLRVVQESGMHIKMAWRIVCENVA